MIMIMTSGMGMVMVMMLLLMMIMMMITMDTSVYLEFEKLNFAQKSNQLYLGCS